MSAIRIICTQILSYPHFKHFIRPSTQSQIFLYCSIILSFSGGRKQVTDAHFEEVDKRLQELVTVYPSAALSTVAAAGTKRLKLSTVDGFHGDEKPLILVNFVCADADKPQGIAFIADALRPNVALSRAAEYNFLFGNLAPWQEGIGVLHRSTATGDKIAAFEGFMPSPLAWSTQTFPLQVLELVTCYSY